MPSAIPDKLILGDKTFFEFPFNNAKKPAEVAYEEVKSGLDGLAETTLLFLANLKVIRWKMRKSLSGEIRRVQHSINHIEVFKKTGKKIISSSHFLRFAAPVEELPKQSVAIAFALDFLPKVKDFSNKVPLSKQLRIVPATQGRVAVFFPAEKENSGLRFHLHAPFVPELSRASIKETPANEPLFAQLAKLSASSLHLILDFKLLTVDLLGVLPNPQDTIPARYQSIRTAIIEEMNSKPLTPTYTKTHAPASNLLQAKASIKALLTVKDLGLLVDYEDVPPRWAVGASQINSNQDRFLSGLNIQKWDFSQFFEMLQNKTSIETSHSTIPNNITSQDVTNWLTAKSAEWHQQLYSLIYGEINLIKTEYLRNRMITIIKKLKIVRLGNNSYCIGGKSYFPNDCIACDELIPLVHHEVYTSGKNKTQQEEARKLLKAIGVSEIGEAEQVKSILQQRYSNQNVIFDDISYSKDIKRFIALVEKEPDTSDMFSGYFIFKNASNQWAKPNSIFLDSPYCQTDLCAYYETLGQDAKKEALSDWYQSDILAMEKLVKFAQIIGVEDGLNLLETTCNNNLLKKHLYGASGVIETSYKIDRDYYMPLLHKVIDAKNIQVSRVIWRAMCRHSAGKLVAQYRKSKSGGIRSAPSLVINWLDNYAWIPQGNGEFVRPLKASFELLPEGFTFNKEDDWLKAIRFGEEEEQRSVEYMVKRETAKKLGFIDDNSLVDAQWFAGLDVEERQRFKNEVERKRKFVLPESSSRNPEQRADRVEHQAAEAPGRETEKRQRAVSISREEVKQEAGQYLSQQYTNVDGEMICQICKSPLPFKLDNGNYYFEKVELFQNIKQRHYQNYLTLCPNHSAMFQHTNGSKDIMFEMFQELTGNELEVVLAQSDMSIYFTSTHRDDLRTVMGSVEGIENAQDILANE